MRFKGEYRYMSNFSQHHVEYDGYLYKSAEHAFQAAKTEDDHWKTIIKRANSSSLAKQLGRRAPLRPDWEEIKLQVM